MCAPRWFQRTSRLSRRPIKGMYVLIFWTALRGSQNSSVTLSQVMNHGFWSTALRQNAKFRSGTLQTPPSRESDSGKWWHVCDQALHALGCCTTTTSHVTRQSPSINFWQIKAFLCFPSPPIRQISVPVTSFYSPGSKTT